MSSRRAHILIYCMVHKGECQGLDSMQSSANLSLEVGNPLPTGFLYYLHSKDLWTTFYLKFAAECVSSLSSHHLLQEESP